MVILKEFLMKNWEFFFDEAKPALLQVVPISSCLYDYGNDIILLFPQYSFYPKYVVKIARNSNYNFKLQNEFDALKFFFEIETVSKYIPRPYHIGEVHEKAFFIQRGFPGTNLFNMIRERGITPTTTALLNDSVDILVTINSADGKAGNNISHGKELQPDFLRLYESELINLGLSKKSMENIRSEYYLLNEKRSYFLHGDYWQTNILVENDKIKGVIDWEFSTRNASVPSDIFWFLINLAFCNRSEPSISSTIADSFKSVFFGENQDSSLMFSLLQRYFQNSLDPKLVKLFLKLTLIEMSLREYITYGAHTNMDKVCISMLNFLISNEKSFFLKEP